MSVYIRHSLLDNITSPPDYDDDDNCENGDNNHIYRFELKRPATLSDACLLYTSRCV